MRILPIVRLVLRRRTYHVIIHHPGQPRTSISTGTQNQKLAKEVRKQIELREVTKALGFVGLPVTPEKKTAPPLPRIYREFVRFVRTRGCVRSHVRNVRRQIRFFFEFVKPKDLNEVNRAHIEEFLNKVRSEGQGQKSIMDKYTILNAAFRWAKDHQHIEANPCDGIEIRKPTRIPVKIVDATLVRKMIESETGYLEKAILGIAAFAGLRTSEIAGLLWNEVDLEGRWIYIGNREGRRTKTASNRRTPIMDNLLPLLHALPRGDGRVFANFAAHEDTFSDVGPLRILRHTCLTGMLRSGASIATVAEWAGNSAATIEKSYWARNAADPVVFKYLGKPLVPQGIPADQHDQRRAQ